MKMNCLVVVASSALVFLFGCVVGHQDYVDFFDSRIGQVMDHKKTYKFSNAGQFSRGDYVIHGQGLTRITENRNDDLVYHYSDQEILPNSRTEQEWIGKCLIYYVVDPNTYVIKGWGFDKGGNPLSCRTWS